jgi:hypothetical protein
MRALLPARGDVTATRRFGFHAYPVVLVVWRVLPSFQGYFWGAHRPGVINTQAMS